MRKIPSTVYIWRIRLGAQDIALSRQRQGFESPMRYHRFGDRNSCFALWSRGLCCHVYFEKERELAKSIVRVPFFYPRISLYASGMSGLRCWGHVSVTETCVRIFSRAEISSDGSMLTVIISVL